MDNFKEKHLKKIAEYFSTGIQTLHEILESGRFHEGTHVEEKVELITKLNDELNDELFPVLAPFWPKDGEKVATRHRFTFNMGDYEIMVHHVYKPDDGYVDGWYLSSNMLRMHSIPLKSVGIEDALKEALGIVREYLHKRVQDFEEKTVTFDPDDWHSNVSE